MGRFTVRGLAIATVVLLSTIAGCAMGSDGRSPVSLSSNSSRPGDRASEAAFQLRSLAIRQRLAALDLAELDRWWRREKIGDPHKYLLPVIVARLSLEETDESAQIWQILRNLERDKPDLYHFRSYLDVRLFFEFRDRLPDDITASYRQMLQPPRVFEWLETGTENHMYMHRLSGLALMDGSGFSMGDPATPATIEGWFRAELQKLLTVGQGEFHSSIYYGYSIGGLLNLYDFAKTQERRELAKAALDWLATNLALRLSWGTIGGAESRGFDRQTWNSGAAAVAWMWWGDNTDPEAIASQMNSGQARLALPVALSSYRPPPHLKALAQKQVKLPFLLEASHPTYYGYHDANRFWERFYVSEDYSLATLINPEKSYQVKGTINAQYATYKLVARDREGQDNAVMSLGGTYHSPMATGSSPGDRYLQGRAAVMYQLILNPTDIEAGVPARSHLVLPNRYGDPRRHGDWYVWQIENIWLCARAWGDAVRLQNPVSPEREDYQALVATGRRTAWITDIATVRAYPSFAQLTDALDRATVNDSGWSSEGQLHYTSLDGDRLEMTDTADRSRLNGQPYPPSNAAVLDSPYVRQPLDRGELTVEHPQRGRWQLRGTLTQPQWSESR